MAKVQTRKTISVKGTTYRALMAECRARGLSGSGVLEGLIAQWLAQRAPGRQVVPLTGGGLVFTGRDPAPTFTLGQPKAAPQRRRVTEDE